MAYYKFTVVGGVAIPNYVKAIAALTGINGCLFYCYSHRMDSKYGVKLPKQLTGFVPGTSAILAGHTAYDLYCFNKLLERMRATDRMEFEKMRAGKHQKFRAFSMLLLSGAMSLTTVTAYEVYKFHMDFEKKRAMEEKENSANPYSVCEWIEKKGSGMDGEDGSF